MRDAREHAPSRLDPQRASCYYCISAPDYRGRHCKGSRMVKRASESCWRGRGQLKRLPMERAAAASGHHRQRHIHPIGRKQRRAQRRPASNKSRGGYSNNGHSLSFRKSLGACNRARGQQVVAHPIFWPPPVSRGRSSGGGRAALGAGIPVAEAIYRARLSHNHVRAAYSTTMGDNMTTCCKLIALGATGSLLSRPGNDARRASAYLASSSVCARIWRHRARSHAERPLLA